MLCSVALVLCFTAASLTATFGTIVPIRGHVSDIALDEGRGVVLCGQFHRESHRGDIHGQPLVAVAIQLQPFPLDFTWLAFPTLALSPDGRYLVVGQYVFTTPPPTACTPPPSPLPLAIIDLVGKPCGIMLY